MAMSQQDPHLPGPLLSRKGREREFARGASSRRALAALSLAMLLSSLGTSIANVGLPTFAQAFGATFQQVQWVVLAYLLAVTSLIVGAGRLGDLIGRRRLLLGGIALFSAASLLAGAAPTLWLLVAARAAQGAGAAAMMALAMALVGETVSNARTGRAMGLLGSMSAIGTALGPSLGGILIAGMGWRALFLINLPIGMLAFLLALRHLPADPPLTIRDRSGADVPGTLLLALTLGAYALAATVGPGFGALNLALLAAAVIGAGLFLRVETRSESPLIRPAMFREPGLSSSLLAGALVATVMMATLVVGPFYLSAVLGLDSARVGLVMSAGPLVAAFTAAPAGGLADRIGARPAALIGLAAMAAGCILLSLIPATLGIAGYAAPMVVLTAGYALFQTANNSAAMAGVEPGRRGLVSGLLNLSRNLGLVTGASLMGAVFVAGGLRPTFAVAAALVVAALAIAAGAGQRLTRTPFIPG
jgi:EmrB/QacA subfamily drug resistance transporter